MKSQYCCCSELPSLSFSEFNNSYNSTGRFHRRSRDEMNHLQWVLISSWVHQKQIDGLHCSPAIWRWSTDDRWVTTDRSMCRFPSKKRNLWWITLGFLGRASMKEGLVTVSRRGMTCFYHRLNIFLRQNLWFQKNNQTNCGSAYEIE